LKLPRREFLKSAAAAALASTATPAFAQTYPNRPVRILVGFAAGGGTDVAARILAEWLSQQLGQQFVVENRTGMGGNLASQAAASSAPDGYTLLFAGPNATISASLYKKLPYNLLRDTVPVGAVLHFPNLMVVPTSFPAKTVTEFIDYAKAHPGEVSLASSGAGASPHLSGELFKFMAKIDLVHVPYRGSSAAYPDLMTGKVHVLFDNLGGPVLELVRGGKLRALGVTTAKRWDTLPEIPAIAETVPGYAVDIWYGVYAPKSTPPQVVTALNKAINLGLADPHMKARLAEGGGEPMPMTTEEFGKFTADDIEKWRKVIEFAGVSAD
jgi:tripartite-type tricarboxylate transporter receptor subunit TctC